MEQQDNSKKKNPRGVQSIDIGGRILNEIIAAGGSVQLKDLSAKTGLATGKLHPYLVSFCNMQLLEKSEHGRYALGPFALHLGLARLRSQNAVREAITRSEQLSNELGLVVSVSVWGPYGPTIIHIEEVIDPVHFNIRVGGVYYLTMTAAGYVFRAFLPHNLTDEVLEREFSDHEGSRRQYFSVDRPTYNNLVHITKDRGYGVTRDMPTPGITAMAAPVFDHSGSLRLCMAAIGPNDLFDLDNGNEVASRLLKFTRSLSHDLGYTDVA